MVAADAVAGEDVGGLVVVDRIVEVMYLRL
jgi:hypothetical protein